MPAGHWLAFSYLRAEIQDDPDTLLLSQKEGLLAHLQHENDYVKSICLGSKFPCASALEFLRKTLSVSFHIVVHLCFPSRVEGKTTLMHPLLTS